MADVNYNSNIVSLFKPTILLEELAIKDTESDDQDYKVSEDHAKPSKVYGNIAPFVKINGYVFDHHDILSMSFSEIGFLPTLDISIRDEKGIFKSAYFPKQQPILSLYIRSKHDKLKCIRCDFLVQDVDSNSSADKENLLSGRGMTLNFTCVLFVPEIYSSIPKAYSKMTSMEVLQLIAADLQLGFATNEQYTNDVMTWIKPLIAKNNFMQHVLVRAFKDDSSFYTGFVDRYYHLNFINVAKVFEEKGDLDKLYSKLLTYDDLLTRSSDTKDDDESVGLILTNFSKLAKSDMYIVDYRPESDTGNRLVNSGYVRSVSYYDQMLSDKPQENVVKLEISPLSTSLKPGESDPAQKNLKTLSSNLSYGEWAGIDYNNGHDNFQYSQLQNAHNNNEINKITLYIKMNGVNLNIMRGMRVPVVIMRYTQGDSIDFDAHLTGDDAPVEGVDKDSETLVVRDKWLSGYYMVGSMRFRYDPRKGFYTEAKLQRMNWDEPEARIESTLVKGNKGESRLGDQVETVLNG